MAPRMQRQPLDNVLEHRQFSQTYLMQLQSRFNVNNQSSVETNVHTTVVASQ